MKSKRELLLTGNINNLLFKFSTPAIIGMVVGALYNIIDTIFIGKGVGTLAIAALIITILRQILFLIPAVLILPLFFGLNGVWMSMPVSDFLSILIAGVLIYREIGKFNKLIVSQSQLGI